MSGGFTMKELSASNVLLAETECGPIVEVQISGNVKSREGGITSLVESSLPETPVAGVVFNLSDLVYVSWDDIGLHSIIAATKQFTRPCCILSTGRNRRNLGDLLIVTKLGEIMGGQVFADSRAAVGFIVESLEKGTA